MAPHASTVTNGLGDFRFDGLPPGDYTVAEAPAIGWINVRPTQVEVTVIAGGQCSTVLFENRQADADAYEYAYPDADEHANQYTHDADEHTTATPTNLPPRRQPSHPRRHLSR